MAGAVLVEETGDMLEYRQLIRHPEYPELWGAQHGKVIGRVAQGLPGIIEGTDTIKFITRKDIPADRQRDVTNARIVCSVRPEKADPNRVRITIDRNRINYPGNVNTPTADLLTVKLLINSVICSSCWTYRTSI